MRTRRTTALVVAAVCVSFALVGPVRAADSVPGGEVLGPLRAVGPEGFDGYVVRPAEPTLLDEVRSLVLTGRRVDPLDAGARAVGEVGGVVRDRFESAGVLVADLDAGAARELAASGAVAAVDPNIIVGHVVRVADESDAASWGLGMLDRDYRTAGPNDAYRFTSDGTGVDVYIVDSGI